MGKRKAKTTIIGLLYRETGKMNDINNLLCTREIDATNELANITADKFLKRYLQRKIGKHYFAVTIRDINRRCRKSKNEVFASNKY